VLYTFDMSGGSVSSSLIRDEEGNFYGTTAAPLSGGGPRVKGSVFELKVHTPRDRR
jgi:hypothetical protein